MNKSYILVDTPIVLYVVPACLRLVLTSDYISEKSCYWIQRLYIHISMRI